MKSAAFGFVNYFLSDPRRTVAIALVVLTVVVFTLAVVPGGVALAEDITSGS
jgi:hypothetical protein